MRGHDRTERRQRTTGRRTDDRTGDRLQDVGRMHMGTGHEDRTVGQDMTGQDMGTGHAGQDRAEDRTGGTGGTGQARTGGKGMDRGRQDRKTGQGTGQDDGDRTDRGTGHGWRTGRTDRYRDAMKRLLLIRVSQCVHLQSSLNLGIGQQHGRMAWRQLQ